MLLQHHKKKTEIPKNLSAHLASVGIFDNGKSENFCQVIPAQEPALGLSVGREISPGPVASGSGTAVAICWMESYYTGGISNPFLTKSKIIAAVFTPVKLAKASV